MRRINNTDLFQLGNLTRPLRGLKNPRLRDAIFDCFVARNQLAEFLQARPEMIYCRQAAIDLIAALTAVTARADSAPNDPEKVKAYWEAEVPAHEVYGITYGVQVFDNNLAAELRLLDTYLVSQKGIYSTRLLVEEAERQFPPELLPLLTDKAKEDFRQAGRCLAFELPTACGFHSLRAVEAVMRSYYEKLTGKELEERLPTWDAYIKKLKEANGDERVILLLDQVREKHRNPVMHPEETLSVNQAMALFGLSQSAIIAMLENMVLKALPQTGS